MYEEEDIPAGSETRELSELEHGKEIDLEKLPTRKERLGYESVERVSRYYKSAKKWAREVMCPVCGGHMEMLKGRKGRYGENLTFQCKAQTAPGEYCLCVIVLTVGNNMLMRPGDFESCDFDWKAVAGETIAVNDGDNILQSRVEEGFKMPSEAPPNPWSRQVQARVIWEVFWRIALETGGRVPIERLMSEVQEVRPKDKSGRPLFKLRREMSTLTRWMSDRTGFVVKARGEEFYVVGKANGSYDMYPFSEEKYREKFKVGDKNGSIVES